MSCSRMQPRFNICKSNCNYLIDLDWPETFLPALSKILYGANLPIRSWTHVVSSSPTSESE
jgi:hypothetical protein